MLANSTDIRYDNQSFLPFFLEPKSLRALCEGAHDLRVFEGLIQLITSKDCVENGVVLIDFIELACNWQI
eukprot:1020295-Pelagomonas_calceolata.AAC.1